MKPTLLLLALCLLSCKPSSPPPVIPPAPPPPEASLFDLLAQERAAQSGRPNSAAPRAEALAADLGLSSWKQVLARPVAARYCIAGSNAQGLAVAICEYDHPAAAAAGRARSRALFDRLIPHRELQVRGSTLVTISRPL